MIRLAALLAVALCTSPILGATFQPSIKRNIQQQEDESSDGPTMRDVVCVAFAGVISGYVYSLNKKIKTLETALNNQANYENRMKNIEGALARGHKPNTESDHKHINPELPRTTQQNYNNVINELHKKRKAGHHVPQNSVATDEQKTGVYPDINSSDSSLSIDTLLHNNVNSDFEGSPFSTLTEEQLRNNNGYRPVPGPNYDPRASNIDLTDDYIPDDVKAQNIFTRPSQTEQQHSNENNGNNGNPMNVRLNDEPLVGNEPDTDNESVDSTNYDELGLSDNEHDGKKTA